MYSTFTRLRLHQTSPSPGSSLFSLRSFSLRPVPFKAPPVSRTVVTTPVSFNTTTVFECLKKRSCASLVRSTTLPVRPRPIVRLSALQARAALWAAGRRRREFAHTIHRPCLMYCLSHGLPATPDKIPRFFFHFIWRSGNRCNKKKVLFS